MYRRFSLFIKSGLWEDPVGEAKILRMMRLCLRILVITAVGWRDRMLLLRASALSYTTLLAVVPLLAVAFSMLKGFGFHERIERILLKYLTAGQEPLVRQILAYISNTDFKALGAFGVALLLYSVIMMLGNVEQSFNDIWGVKRPRSVVRKISDYISVLILGPLLMVVATALITSLSSNTIVRTLLSFPLFAHFYVLISTVLPHAVLWIAFTAMYLIMPNTRVRFFPALAAGVLCGSIWEGSFRFYTEFNIGVARFNKIYGTFAALPVFIIWIYVSWVIVLVGAQVANAIQHMQHHSQRFKKSTFSAKEGFLVGLATTYLVCKKFIGGCPPLGPEDLSSELQLPYSIILRVTGILCQEGILTETAEGDTGRLIPSRDPSRIRVKDIFCALWNLDSGELNIDSSGPGALAKQIEARLEKECRGSLFLNMREIAVNLEIDPCSSANSPS